MGAGRVLCDDVLRRRMRTCVLSVSSTVGRSVDPGTTSRHFGAETKILTNQYSWRHWVLYALATACIMLVRCRRPPKGTRVGL